MAGLQLLKLSTGCRMQSAPSELGPVRYALRPARLNKPIVKALSSNGDVRKNHSSTVGIFRCSGIAKVRDSRSVVVRSAAYSDNAPPNLQEGGGDKGGTPPTGGYGGGGGGDDNNEKGDYPDVVLPSGKTVDALPADMQGAFLAGKVPQEIVNRYFEMNTNFFLRFLLTFRGLRERLLADPSFLIKLAIECGIGVFTKCSAEYAKRGDNFFKEADFVFANVIMAIIADYMLTYLPAPTLSFAPKVQVKQNAIQKFFASCPENAFQKVPVGYQPFTVPQRVGAVVRNGTKLLGVGFGASMLGVGITNVLIGVRQLLEPGWMPPNAPQNPLVMSASYATYMASSSNLRYQIVAGVLEERGIEVLFKSNPTMCHILSFILRTSNTYLGSLLWVDYIRLLGLQPKH